MAHLLASSQHSQAPPHSTEADESVHPPLHLIRPSSVHSLKPADLTLEEAGSRLRQALDKASHTNDIHQRTTQSVSLPTSVNLSTCQVLIAVFVVYPHSVPSHVTLHCYLSLYCTHGWLVGWLVCLLLPYSTEHNSLTVSSHHRHLYCEPQSSSHFRVNPPLLLSIPNIYYETSLYNSLHQIVYSTYIQMSSVSCQISRPLLAVLQCWLVCETLNSVAVCIYVSNAVIFSVTLSSPTYLKVHSGLACLMLPNST